MNAPRRALVHVRYVKDGVCEPLHLELVVQYIRKQEKGKNDMNRMNSK